MELLTLAAIIAGIIAVIIGLIVVIKKISAFYKQRFQFSIWSGVLLLVVALALLLISSADGTTQQTVYVMLVIAAILALLTIYNDIRLAGVAWGGLAVLLQIIFALSFVFLIIFALIGFVMKKLFNIHSSLLTFLHSMRYLIFSHFCRKKATAPGIRFSGGSILVSYFYFYYFDVGVKSPRL